MALGGALGLGLGARDAAAFCVAGVAQTHIYCRFAWQAWHFTHTHIHTRKFNVNDAAPFCVAGVAQPFIHLRFTWQAWHKLISTVVLRGRRVTDGTGWRAWPWFRRGILRGRRGANSHLLSFCVAGVAQPYIHLRFTWQAWHKLTSTVVLRGRRGTDGTGWRAWPWFRRP